MGICSEAEARSRKHVCPPKLRETAMSTTVRPPNAVKPSVRKSSSDGSIRTTMRPAKKRISLGGVALLSIIVGGVAYGAWYGMSSLRTSGDSTDSMFFTVVRRSFPVIEEVKGELKAAITTEIRSKVDGRTSIVWVIDEGATVEKGDLLVRLASDQIEERISKEEATEASAIAGLEAAEKDLDILIDQNKSDVRKAALLVEVAETELKKYVEGDAIKELMDAELEIERAAQQHERAKLDYEAAKSLRDQKFITESEFLRDEFAVSEADRAGDKAKLSLRILQDYAHPQELRKRDSDVAEATQDLARVKKSTLAKEAQKRADVAARRANLLNTQAQLNKFRRQLEYTEIRAPTPGLVIYNTGHRHNPRKVEVGVEVYEQQAIVTLPDPRVMVVSVRIHEAKTNRIKLGQKVNIEIEGIPDRIFTGEITKIAPLADSSNKWLNPDLKEYETEITLDPTDADLKPGVTARTEILIAQVENVLCVPPQAVFSKSGLHYVFRKDGNRVEPVEVTIGMSSTDYVEVSSGLGKGDRIALAVSDDDKRMLPNLERPRGAALSSVRNGKPARAQAGASKDRDRGMKGKRTGASHRRSG